MHGEGCARIFDCVEALLDIGYAGPVSIEHHSFDRDPTPECARALTMMSAFLRASTASSTAY